MLLLAPMVHFLFIAEYYSVTLMCLSLSLCRLVDIWVISGLEQKAVNILVKSSCGQKFPFSPTSLQEAVILIAQVIIL
jgi:exosortase/archaeosortase